MTVTTNIHVGLSAWASGQTVTAGSRRSSNGAAWQATNSGTTGSTAPTGTVPVNDGFVTWNWLSTIDYATLQAWVNGWPATLTQNLIGQIWNDGPITATAGTTLMACSGHTMGAYTATLTCAPGESLRDAMLASASVPLAYNPSYGVAVVLPATAGNVKYFNIGDTNVIIDGLQFSDPLATSGSSIINVLSGGTNCAIRNCVLSGYGQTGGASIVTINANASLDNTVIIDNMSASSAGTSVYCYAGTLRMVNSLLICLSGNTAGIGIAAIAGVARNSALFGYATPVQGSAGVVAVDHCITSISAASSAMSDAGGNIYNAAPAAQYVSVGSSASGGSGTTTTGTTNSPYSRQYASVYGVVGETTSTGTTGTTGNGPFSTQYASVYGVGTPTATSNFRLQAGSQCILAGVFDTADIPTADDLARRPRGTGAWDIGPYTYAAKFSAVVQAIAAHVTTLTRQTGVPAQTFAQQLTTALLVLPHAYPATAATATGLTRQTSVPLPATAAQTATLASHQMHVLRTLTAASASLLRMTGVPVQVAGGIPGATLRHLPSKVMPITTHPIATTTHRPGKSLPATSTSSATVSHIQARTLYATGLVVAEFGHVIAVVGQATAVTQTSVIRTTYLIASVLQATTHPIGNLIRSAKHNALAAGAGQARLSRAVTLIQLAASAIASSFLSGRVNSSDAQASAGAQASLRRGAQHNAVASAYTASSIARRTGAMRAASATATTALARAIVARRPANAGASASATAIRAHPQTLSASAVVSASLARRAGRIVPVSVSAVVSMSRALVYGPVTALAGAVASVTYGQGKTFQAVAAVAVNRTAGFVRNFSASAQGAASLVRRMLHATGATAVAQASIVRVVGKVATALATAVSTVGRTQSHTFPASTRPTASMSFFSATHHVQVLQASAAVVASAVRTTGRTARAIANQTTSLIRLIGNVTEQAGAISVVSLTVKALIRLMLRQRVMLPAAVRSVVLPPDGDPTMSDQVADPPAFSDMDPADEDTLTFDWSRRANIGDAIVSATVTSEPPGLNFVGTPLIAGFVVQAVVNGVILPRSTVAMYGVRCTAVFASGRQSSWTIPLPIRNL